MTTKKRKNSNTIDQTTAETEILGKKIESKIVTTESLQALEDRKRLINRGKADDSIVRKMEMVEELYAEAIHGLKTKYLPHLDLTDKNDCSQWVQSLALLAGEINNTFHNDEKAKRSLREVDVDKYGNVVNVGIKNEVSENGTAPILLSVDSKILDTENDT